MTEQNKDWSGNTSIYACNHRTKEDDVAENDLYCTHPESMQLFFEKCAERNFEIPVKVLLLSVLAFILSSCVSNMITINSWAKFIVIGGGTGVFALALYAIGLIVMKKGWLASVWPIQK